ncbi:NAD-dependent protein deacetylase hst2-1 [Grifola frondosa]|uniref:NAD-dependent protein deacetylase hst2-1 n=1 Tax=Grifola frondosa TaxID=5627 RepID=A0A1C7M2N9_GRIFR|nr:NAD-dependent protein deacetylase hst2-1 [Grifola frondosa]
MGAEQSVLEGPPEVLEARDLASVAKYMKSEECKNVFVMIGAGVSTSAGIPDFRSPGTGLYHNLARLNLPYPEAVFEINYFRENPLPFYTLARELYPGHFRPTLTHSFVRVLAAHSLLRVCFTQNIDTLERRAGVPAEHIVEAHGSFASQRCIECQMECDSAMMKDAVEQGKVLRCQFCNGLVKPDIVFFGEALPPSFHYSIHKLQEADLLIVIGTSLKVHPFASLTSLVPMGCPRVLINLDPAGDIGSRPDDVVLLGKCDDVVRDLCRELGWEQELDKAWAETASALEYREPKDEFAEEERKALKKKEERKKEPSPLPEVKPLGPEEDLERLRLQEELEELTLAVEQTLEITEKLGGCDAEDDEESISDEVTTREEVPVPEDKEDTQATGGKSVIGVEPVKPAEAKSADTVKEETQATGGALDVETVPAQENNSNETQSAGGKSTTDVETVKPVEAKSVSELVKEKL